MGEYAAILTWTSIGAAVAGLLVLFHVRVAPRRRPPEAPVALATAVSARTLGRLQRHAALIVAFAFLALVLAAWAAAAAAVGRAGLAVAVVVTVPLLVGFAHATSRRDPAASEEAPAGDGASPPAAAGEDP